MKALMTLQEKCEQSCLASDVGFAVVRADNTELWTLVNPQGQACGEFTTEDEAWNKAETLNEQ
jgi:hypothetical protein